MMQFRTLKDNIITILGAAAAGRFVTVGFQRQSRSADEIKDSSRTVQLYYSSGDLPRGSAGLTGPAKHVITYRIDLSVSKAAVGDLSVINNPAATPVQISAALAAFQEAADLADQSIDELIEIVYQILMDARNVDLGFNAGGVADRWLSNIEKDNPLPRGDLVVLTASMRLTCSVSEDVLGDSGTAATEFDNVVNIEGDDVEKTGVFVDNS